MKYAIIEISGRQFWIEKERYYDLNRIPTQPGNKIMLNRILLVNNNDEIFIGKPYLYTVKIKGKILNHFKSKKKIIYKMRPKKKMKKKYGHRQKMTRIFIEDILIK